MLGNLPTFFINPKFIPPIPRDFILAQCWMACCNSVVVSGNCIRRITLSHTLSLSDPCVAAEHTALESGIWLHLLHCAMRNQVSDNGVHYRLRLIDMYQKGRCEVRRLTVSPLFEGPSGTGLAHVTDWPAYEINARHPPTYRCDDRCCCKSVVTSRMPVFTRYLCSPTPGHGAVCDIIYRLFNNTVKHTANYTSCY